MNDLQTFDAGLEKLGALLRAVNREIGEATPETFYHSRHVIDALLESVDEEIADLRKVAAGG